MKSCLEAVGLAGFAALALCVAARADGLGDYAIVVPDGGLTKAESFVVEDVNGLLARSLGKALPVVPQKSAPKERRIFVRRAPAWFDYEPLGERDAAVVARGGDVWLFGRGVNGFRYAAYDWLVLDLGYRFFDARGGVKVPDLAAYVPADGERIVRFAFADRETRPVHRSGREGALFLFRSGYNNAMEASFEANGLGRDSAVDEFVTPWPYCHGLMDYFPRNRAAARFEWAKAFARDYDREMPECFTLTKDGRRNPEHQPCLSNPEVRRVTCRNYFNRLARLERPSHVDLSAGDTPGRFCWCEKCRALETKYGTPGGPLLDLLLSFAPEAAARCPGQKLWMLAYRKRQTEIPPKGLDRLPDNLVPNFAPIDDDFSKDWTHPNNADTLGNLREWGRLARSLSVWYYPNPYGEAITPPLGNVRRLATDIRLMKEAGATATFFEHNVGVAQMTAWSELQSYLMARLFRDTTLDADVLVDEFLAFEYGVAAKGVRSYLDALEKLTLECRTPFSWDASIRRYEHLTPERLAKWAAAFDVLEKTVADDRTRLRNVRRLRLSLDMATLKRTKDVSILPRIRAELGEMVEDCYDGRFRHEGQKFVKGVETQLHLIEVQYGPNARPLPAAIFGGIPSDLLTVALPESLCGGTVEDKGAAYGTAAVLDSRFKAAAEQMKLPFVANIETYLPSSTFRSAIGPGVTVENIGEKGAYKFYYMGETTLTPEIRVEFGDYHIRSKGISDAYKMGAFNKARIYASFRFQGPAFYPGDAEPNKVFCDRIVVVRDHDGEVPCK